MLRRTWVPFALVAALTSATANAQEPAESPATQEARRRFDIAEQLFDQGNYAGALREWEQVYELLEGHPNRARVLFNIGRAYQELNRTREALTYYRRFLAETQPDAPMRDTAAQTIRELELRAEIEGTGAGGGFSPSPVGITIASVGAAAMIAGGILGGVALAQDGSARAQCGGGACPADAYGRLLDAHTMANAADGLLWGGLAVLATGVVLTIVLGESGGEPRPAAGCTTDGCGVLVQGVF